MRFCPHLCAVLNLSRMTYMTIEQFRQLHEEWKQSGLSVQQYCENTGLNPTSTLSGDIILHVNQLRFEKFLVGTTDFYREEDWRVECDNA